MGTRSLTNVYDEDGKNLLVTIYRQYDGYPSGLGVDLKKILANRPVVNGYGGDDEKNRAFNGSGCLAAQLIGDLKQGKIGNVYIHEPKPQFSASAHLFDAEYGYKIYPKDGKVFMEVFDLYGDRPKQLFADSIDLFDAESIKG